MTTTTAARRGRMILFTAITTLLAAASAHADLLELVNGDHYNGIVIALTQTNLEFKSEIQGVVKIPRDKVARITLRTPAQRKTTGHSATNAPAGDAADVVSPAVTGQPDQSVQIVQQMRDQGVDPNLMNQIQQQLLGQSSPDATRMFNDMVGGLQSGSLSMGDIRSQAISAIKDIQAAKKDLGGDTDTSGLLDGYLAILQKFVQETEPPPAKAPAPQAKPPRPAQRVTAAQ